jgi:hypothetical protein
MSPQKCCKCKTVQDKESFYLWGGDLMNVCKGCHNSARRKYHHEHYISKRGASGADLYPEHIRLKIIAMIIEGIAYGIISKQLRDLDEVKAIKRTSLTAPNIKRWHRAGQLSQISEPLIKST